MNLKRYSLVIALVLAVSPALGLSPEGRGAAMGGAYSPFAKGAEGVWYNPAVIGDVTLAGVIAGGGVEFSNNALTMMEVKDLLSEGTGQAEALAKIKDEGEWNARIDAVGGGAVDILGWVGLGVYPHVSALGFDVSSDAVDYTLNAGLTPGKTSYHLTGTFQNAMYNEILIASGHELPFPLPFGKLSVGAAVKIYKGVDFKMMYADNTVDTVNLLNNKGESFYAESTSGKGFGFDLGAHAALAVVDVSLALKNIASSIKWDAMVQGGQVNPATLTLTSVSGAMEVEQTLPMTVLLGVGGHIPVVGTAASAEMEIVGATETKGETGDAIDTSEAETLIRIGFEQSFFGILNLRAGYVAGAPDSSGQVTFGLGLGALVARLDLAAGIGLDQKSGSLGISGSVAF